MCLSNINYLSRYSALRFKYTLRFYSLQFLQHVQQKMMNIKGTSALRLLACTQFVAIRSKKC